MCTPRGTSGDGSCQWNAPAELSGTGVQQSIILLPSDACCGLEASPLLESMHAAGPLGACPPSSATLLSWVDNPKPCWWPGLDEVLVISKSQLELEKEAAAKAAGTAGPSSPPPPPGSPADKVRVCNACVGCTRHSTCACLHDIELWHDRGRALWCSSAARLRM
jgi:hypothetical protein